MIREKMRQNHADNKGINNPNFGKPMTEEQKKKISTSLTGKSNNWKGRHHSEESKLKMSLSAKNRKFKKTA